MTIIDVLHFPGHVFVDHMLAGLFFYVIGLFHMCRGFHLIRPSYYWTQSNNNRRNRKIAIFMMLAGFLYAVIHLAQMGVALWFSETQLASLHNLYAFLGFGFFLAGLLKHVFSKNCFITKSLDPSILIGLGGMSLALFFHPGFTDHEGEEEDYKLQIAIQTGNWLYQRVAIFLFFIGLTDLLEQIQKKKWLLIQASFWLGTAILFVISSEEIVKWMTLGVGTSFGMGPVVVCCMYFVGIHVLILAWISSWKNRNKIEEINRTRQSIEDYEEDVDETSLDVHMPVYSGNDTPMVSLRNRKIPARPTFSLKSSDSGDDDDDNNNNSVIENDISSSSSSSSSDKEEKGEEDVLISD